MIDTAGHGSADEETLFIESVEEVRTCAHNRGMRLCLAGAICAAIVLGCVCVYTLHLDPSNPSSEVDYALLSQVRKKYATYADSAGFGADTVPSFDRGDRPIMKSDGYLTSTKVEFSRCVLGNSKRFPGGFREVVLVCGCAVHGAKSTHELTQNMLKLNVCPEECGGGTACINDCMTGICPNFLAELGVVTAALEAGLEAGIEERLKAELSTVDQAGRWWYPMVIAPAFSSHQRAQDRAFGDFGKFFRPWKGLPPAALSDMSCRKSRFSCGSFGFRVCLTHSTTYTENVVNSHLKTFSRKISIDIDIVWTLKFF